jgi:hypothetical protein
MGIQNIRCARAQRHLPCAIRTSIHRWCYAIPACDASEPARLDRLEWQAGHIAVSNDMLPCGRCVFAFTGESSHQYVG